MNLNELIQALTELKEQGKVVDKLPVRFFRRMKKNKSIDRVNIYIDSSGKGIDCIELISLS